MYHSFRCHVAFTDSLLSTFLEKMYLQTRSNSSALSLQYKGHYVVSCEHTKKPYQARIRNISWVKIRIRCIQQRAIDHDCSFVFMSSLWPSVAWFAVTWGYICTTVLNSNKHSLLTCWLKMCCKLCLKHLIIIQFRKIKIRNAMNYEIQ